jgi:regulator of nonsense transcripts 2
MVMQASGTNVEQDADSESEEEHIFVARQEELDPETEAEFDRAFEKMLTESLESRRFELKVMFHHRCAPAYPKIRTRYHHS